jgi:SAM-dependent methyltransferase
MEQPNMSSNSAPKFVAHPVLDEAAYLRARLQPAPDDSLYLHLADLRQALDAALPPPGGRILDYGCGGSPYQALFRASCYHRADIPGIPNLDFIFGEDSRLAAQTGDYDCVLSTQVLEHVKEVGTYLRECRRVLRSTGRLILTTHGTFPDHGCPHDFWRWTADGLRAELEGAGFKVERLDKLTTGPRALLLLNQLFNDRLLVTRASPAAWMLRLSRLAYTQLSRRRLNELADCEYAACRIVPPDVAGHELYVALLAVARPG